jgi:hypothetical protein
MSCIRAYRQAGRQTDWPTERQTETGWQTAWFTDLEAGRQAGRQTDRKKVGEKLSADTKKYVILLHLPTKVLSCGIIFILIPLAIEIIYSLL